MSLTVIRVLVRTGTAIVLALLFAITYEVDVLLAPEWTVTIVDEGGQPVERAGVGQMWSLCFEYYIPDSLDYRMTDKSGAVHFPQRTHRLSLASWAFKKTFLSSRSESVEGHCAHSQILYWKKGFADEGYVGWHDGMDSSIKSSRLVLHPCPEGRSGFKCGFDDRLKEWKEPPG